MPTNPNKARKAVQQATKLFNKLATGLNSDLNEAVRKIEKLRREVQTIKTTLGRARGAATTPQRRTNRTGNTARSTSTHGRSTHPERSKGTHQTTKPGRDTSEYVFPREPFHPPSPPEPSPSGNN